MSVSLRASASSPAQPLSAAARGYYQLTKPNLTLLVVITTFLGVALAAEASVHVVVLLSVLVGTALTSAGACALNMYMESHFDALMQRTQGRPIPSGRVGDSESALFGWSLVVLGTGLLWVGCNPLTAMLGLLAASSYLFAYTPLKRVTPFSTIIGAVPGALPPVMGYTAVEGQFGLAAGLIFGILFFWQLPHFWALAYMYREDYARGGFRVWTDALPRWRSLPALGVVATAGLFCCSVALVFCGAGTVYLLGAALLGVMFFARAFGFLARPETARRLFLYSIAYLPMLIVLLLVDRRASIAHLFGW